MSNNADSSYAKQFANAMQGYISPYQYIYNPYIMNEVLKNVNMNPSGKDRDELLAMVQNPKQNEQGLRQFSEYLYNTQLPFKRLIHYLADMLSFDLSVYPINATEADMKTDTFKREYDKV